MIALTDLPPYSLQINKEIDRSISTEGSISLQRLEDLFLGEVLSENYLRVFYPEWRLVRKFGETTDEGGGNSRGITEDDAGFARSFDEAEAEEQLIVASVSRPTDWATGTSARRTKVKLKSRVAADETGGATVRSYRELLLLLPPARYTTLVSCPTIRPGVPANAGEGATERDRRRYAQGGEKVRRGGWSGRERERDLSFVHAYWRRPKFCPGVRATTWHLDLAPATPHQPMDDGTSHDRANRSNGAVLYDARRPSPSRRTRPASCPLLALVYVHLVRDAVPPYPESAQWSWNITDAYDRIHSILDDFNDGLLGNMRCSWS